MTPASSNEPRDQLRNLIRHRGATSESIERTSDLLSAVGDWVWWSSLAAICPIPPVRRRCRRAYMRVEELVAEPERLIDRTRVPRGALKAMEEAAQPSPEIRAAMERVRSRRNEVTE